MHKMQKKETGRSLFFKKKNFCEEKVKNQLQFCQVYYILLNVRTALPFLQNPLLIIYTPLEHPAAPLPGVHLCGLQGS